MIGERLLRRDYKVLRRGRADQRRLDGAGMYSCGHQSRRDVPLVACTYSSLCPYSPPFIGLGGIGLSETYGMTDRLRGDTRNQRLVFYGDV